MDFFNLFDLSLSLLSLLAWIIESWLLSACVSFFLSFLISLIHEFNFLKSLLQHIILKDS